MLFSIKNLDSKKRTILIAVFPAIVLLILIFFIFRTSSSNVGVLYNDLSPEDVTEVSKFLSSRDISYSIKVGNIYIASSEIIDVRAKLAMLGIPHSGSIVGNEIFNDVGPLESSEFTLNINLRRALEGELARTISAFHNVRRARVHISSMEKSIFKISNNVITASVMLDLRENIDRDQISAIEHLVSNAVPRLQKNNIAIISTSGAHLNRNIREIDGIGNAFENRLREKIESILRRYIGMDGFQVAVTIDADLNNKDVQYTKYDPEGRVLRSSSEQRETNKNDNPSNKVSVENNLPGNALSSDSRGGTASASNSSTNNYEISEERGHILDHKYKINKISIAVLLDDKFDQETGRYIKIKKDTIDRLHKIIVSASALNINRGDILNIENVRFSRIKSDALRDGILTRIMSQLNLNSIVRYICIIVISCIIYKLAIEYMNKINTITNKSDKSDLSDMRDDNNNAENEQNNMSGHVANIISVDPEMGIYLIKKWLKDI